MTLQKLRRWIAVAVAIALAGAAGAQDASPTLKRIADAGEIVLGVRDASIPFSFTIYAKWFGQPIPPRGMVLNDPVSPGLRKALDRPTDSPDPAAYE